MDLKFKTYPFEVKAAADDGSSFEGFVSVFHNIDDYGEIVDDKAFDQDLDAFLNGDGFIGGLNHNWNDPVGTPQPGTRVTDKGLFLRANVIDTTHGMDVRKMLRAGIVKKLSIGYRTLKESRLETPEDVHAYWESKGYTPSAQDERRAARGATVLMRLFLFEGSPVTVAANDLAAITAVKAAHARSLICGAEPAETPSADAPPTDDTPDDDPPGGTELKAATGSMTLPLAPRDRAWDSSAAEKRMRAWAEADDAPNAKYRSGFFFCDMMNSDQFGAYKLPFADVIDGTLTAVPRAIFACAAAVQGARGGVDIPEMDMAGVKRRIARYYARMREAFDDPGLVAPWEGKALPTTVRELEEYLRDAGCLSKSSARALITCLKTLRWDAGDEDEDTTADTKDAGDEPEAQDGGTPPAPETAEEAPASTHVKLALPDVLLQPLSEPVIRSRDDGASAEVISVRSRIARELHDRFLKIPHGEDNG